MSAAENMSPDELRMSSLTKNYLIIVRPFVTRRSYLTFIEIIKPNGCICNPVWWNLRYSIFEQP